MEHLIVADEGRAKLVRVDAAGDVLHVIANDVSSLSATAMHAIVQQLNMLLSMAGY